MNNIIHCQLHPVLIKKYQHLASLDINSIHIPDVRLYSWSLTYHARDISRYLSQEFISSVHMNMELKVRADFFSLSFFCFWMEEVQKVNEFKVFVIIWIWILTVFFSLTIWRQFYPLPVNHLSVAIRREYLLFYKQMVKKSWWMIVLMYAMIYARIKRMIYNSHNEFSTGTKIYIHNFAMELFYFQHVYFDIYLRLCSN